MDIHLPLALLGGLTPQQFMKRHWQKKPLLVRQAVPGMAPLVDRGALFEMAGREEVESRLVVHDARGWRMKRGPLQRRALPPLKQRDWTLLVQGVDLHDDAVHALLQRFRFVPEARLDDLMISYASDGGGVGPHFDSYDVFLLQAHGRRRWRIGRQRDLNLVPGVPLKVLANFTPEQEFVLEPGDMLYLPPRYAHDGIAEGECMTYSIGFRAPAETELARELLLRTADAAGEDEGPARLYADAGQDATAAPGAVPEALQAFARRATEAALADPLALPRALGEYLTEPKGNVWFDPAPDAPELSEAASAVALDRRTRMMYDAHHVFINGESYRAAGRDATLMRTLADTRRLDARAVARCSEGARDLMQAWCDDGWLHPEADTA